MSAATYLRPRSIDAALDALAAGHTVLAGGTDVYPALVGRSVPHSVIDITAIDELHGVDQVARGGRTFWRIGGGTTWAAITGALPDWAATLAGAARQVGAAQIQHVATIAGNLVTASPAADGIPALLALDAEVELRSIRGSRRMPVEQFVVGYRATARATDELLTAVWLPEPRGPTRSAFVKFAGRASLVIAIAMVAAAVERDALGDVTGVRVAVGACAPTAVRLAAVELAVLTGRPLLAGRDQYAELSPIDDVRATAEYRWQVVPELVRRALDECGAAA